MEIKNIKTSNGMSLQYDFSNLEIEMCSKVINYSKSGGSIVLDNNEEGKALFYFIKGAFPAIPQEDMSNMYKEIERVLSLFRLEQDYKDVNNITDIMELFVRTPLYLCNKNNKTWIQEDSIDIYIDDDIDYYLASISEIIPNKYLESFLRDFYIFSMYSKRRNCFSMLHVFTAISSFEKKKKEVYTYVMTDDTGMYKIGKSVTPIQREASLAVGNHTIRLCFYIKGDHEKELHELYATKQIKGEWYHLNEKDLKYIRNYKEIKDKKLLKDRE